AQQAPDLISAEWRSHPFLPSVEFGSRGLDLLRRQLAILFEERAELRGAVADGLEAQIDQEPLLEFRSAHDLARVLAHPGDDFAWRAGWRGQAEVERGVEVGEASLPERRHVGDQPIARLAGDCEGLHLAGFQVRRRA